MFVLNSPENHHPLRPAPPARDTLHFSAVYPDHSDWLLLSMSSPQELRSCLRQPPHNHHSRLSVGVLSRNTFKFEKAKEGGFHAGQVTDQTVSLMAFHKGLNAAAILTENGGCLTVSQIP